MAFQKVEGLRGGLGRDLTGCVRVTNAAMDLLWSSGVTQLGTLVLVY